MAGAKDPAKDGAANAALSLDVTGYRCPIPVLKLQKAISTMKSGGRVLICADDPIAGVDIPHFCTQAGHVLLHQGWDGARFEFLIEARRMGETD